MKIKVCCIFISVLVLFCGCSTSSGYIHGIESFAIDYPSDYELNVYIIPSEDFLKEFEYLNADYSFSFCYEGIINWHDTEASAILIKYTPSIYERAKDFCFRNMMLSNTPIVEYEGFVFYDNIELAVAQERYHTVHVFPKYFNSFAYNDNTNELLFLGYYNSDLTSEDSKNVLSNWNDFIENNFSISRG